jgi:hypothetical protein
MRAEASLIAALVQAAPDDPGELRDLVVAYESTQVWQTLRHKRKVGKIKLKPRRIGRPKL